MTDAPPWRRRDPFKGQTVAFSARYHADRREGRLANNWVPEGVVEADLRGTIVKVANGWLCFVKWQGLPFERVYHRDHIVAAFDIANDAAEWDRRVGARS